MKIKICNTFCGWREENIWAHKWCGHFTIKKMKRILRVVNFILLSKLCYKMKRSRLYTILILLRAQMYILKKQSMDEIHLKINRKRTSEFSDYTYCYFLNTLLCCQALINMKSMTQNPALTGRLFCYKQQCHLLIIVIPVWSSGSMVPSNEASRVSI